MGWGADCRRYDHFGHILIGVRAQCGAWARKAMASLSDFCYIFRNVLAVFYFIDLSGRFFVGEISRLERRCF